MVRSVLRMAAVEGPCIVIMMSSAYTTILTFGAMDSSAISSLMTMYHKVGPENDMGYHGNQKSKE
jgi:hypothetical protein